MTDSGLSRFGSLEDAWREIRRAQRADSSQRQEERESLLPTPIRSASVFAPAVSAVRRVLRRLIRPWIAQQDETNRLLLARIVCLEEALARAERVQKEMREESRTVARREAGARRALLEVRRQLSRGVGQTLAMRTRKLESEATLRDERLAKLRDLLSIGNDAFLLLRREGAPAVSEEDLPPPQESPFVAALAVSGDLRTGCIASAHARALAPKLAGCRGVVDLGCGTGELLEELSRIGVPAFGIDLDADAVEACRRRGLDARVDGLLGALAQEALPAFDGAVLSHVIEHVPPVEALRLLLRVGRRLPEGGLLLVVTPNPESLFTHLVHFWRDPTHVRPYPVELLRRLARATGFSVVEAGEVPETSETAWAL